MDGITANRDINRQRDETRRSDERERERERQSMQQAVAMEREGRESAQVERNYALEVAEFRMKAETMRFNWKMALLDRLPADRRSVAAEELLHQLTDMADDAPVNGPAMLGHDDKAAELAAADIPEQDSGASGPFGD